MLTKNRASSHFNLCFYCSQFLPRDATQSAVLLRQVVDPSVLKNICSISQFPCDSTAFLLVLGIFTARA